MKKKLSTVLLALAAFMSMTAQNLVKGDYGYLYCHMSDKGEWTAYAISRDGYNYQDINGGNPIFNPEEHARIEGGRWLEDTIRFLTERAIPVCGHLGLTPQSVHQFGGYRVQGKTEEGNNNEKENCSNDDGSSFSNFYSSMRQQWGRY